MKFRERRITPTPHSQPINLEIHSINFTLDCNKAASTRWKPSILNESIAKRTVCQVCVCEAIHFGRLGRWTPRFSRRTVNTPKQSLQTVPRPSTYGHSTVAPSVQYEGETRNTLSQPVQGLDGVLVRKLGFSMASPPMGLTATTSKGVRDVERRLDGGGVEKRCDAADFATGRPRGNAFGLARITNGDSGPAVVSINEFSKSKRSI